jgi:hypothetical protein
VAEQLATCQEGLSSMELVGMCTGGKKALSLTKIYSSSCIKLKIKSVNMSIYLTN